jgi:hypothetical protein
MMNYISILAVTKTEIKSFFNDGSWSNDDMTSVIIRRDNGKLIQVFGAGQLGDYHDMEGKEFKLMNDATWRSLGYGKVVDFAEAKNLVKGAAYYVFK